MQISFTRDAFEESRRLLLVDLHREVDWGNAWHDGRETVLNQAGLRVAGGGNFLTALGALCYTEYGGWLELGRKVAIQNFDHFFNKLAPDYKAFNLRHHVYDTFRCGMAHEYYVKSRSYGISLTHTNAFPFEYDPSPGARFKYVFHVSPYVTALEAGFDRLGKTLNFPLIRHTRR